MVRPAAQVVALSAGEAVLGLLIEQSGNSYQLERRLEGRFGSAQFAHGTAYQAVKRLSKQGLIRALDGDQAIASARAEAGYLPATAYEATAEGVEHFERWKTLFRGEIGLLGLEAWGAGIGDIIGRNI